MTPTLEGPRLRLEPLTLDHLPALEAIAYDDRIWRYMTSLVKDRASLQRWAETALTNQRAGTTLPWVTVLKSLREGEPNRPIGATRFADLDLRHRTTELGYTWLAPAYHGSGLNAEAKLLQLDYAFGTLALRRVAFKTHHDNLQSQAALRKLGAIYEGTFRNHYLMPDGSARHSLWFSITPEDWPAIRQNLTSNSGMLLSCPLQSAKGATHKSLARKPRKAACYVDWRGSSEEDSLLVSASFCSSKLNAKTKLPTSS